ncbi:MAG: hypothetical protein PVH45_01545 [Candidatus Omnitrophota bacterium]|jgi:hypothetical protein
MLAGIILVICGILIAIYPPLLSLVVALLLIFLGSLLFVASWRYKKMARKYEDPFIDFFMKM